MRYCQEKNEKQETKKFAEGRWAQGHCQRNVGFHTSSVMPFSAFNPSKCAHTWSSGQPTLQHPGSSLGVRCLAQGSHLSHGQFLSEQRFKPTTSGYKSNALTIRPWLPHKLITSMPRRIEAVIKAKGASTKYWVHIQKINILSRRPTIHKFFIFFIGLMKYSNLLRLNWWVFGKLC